MTQQSLRTALLLGTAVPLLLAAPAQAYLDAGSASMLFQALIGAAAAALVLTKTYWQRIKSMFGGGHKTDSDEQHPAE